MERHPSQILSLRLGNPSCSKPSIYKAKGVSKAEGVTGEESGGDENCDS